MEVEDFDSNVLTTFTDNSYDKGLPALVMHPILSLGSLLGSATNAEFSQIQAFKSTVIGRLKIHLDIVVNNLDTEPAVTDLWVAAVGFFIGQADDIAGGPSPLTGAIIPFNTDVSPLSSEADKDPWSTGTMEGVRRWLLLKFKMLNLGNAMNGNCATWSIHERTRIRAAVIKETDCLYMAMWMYSTMAHHDANNTYVRYNLHVGVPHRFLRR